MLDTIDDEYSSVLKLTGETILIFELNFFEMLNVFKCV